MGKVVRLTENDLVRLVKRIVKEDETEQPVNTQPEYEQPESEPFKNMSPAYMKTIRHNWMIGKDGRLKPEVKTKFVELQQIMDEKLGKNYDARDFILECLVLVGQRKFSPMILEEFIFSRTDIKPKASWIRPGYY